MGKKWHTNKTQPNTNKEYQILVIYKNGCVDVEVPNIDDFGKLYLVGTAYWKSIKDSIKYWQYVDKLFAKEFKEIAKEELRKELGGGKIIV